ncbi:MAG: GIY-YIG nuclease family protein [Chitinophagales bacterium]|nr:GIY-YIG nuclease family protein [Chitinophagales bacterium]
MLYAIVDIETTGSYAAGNGITEIAIVVHDGEKVLDVYESLVNPHQEIPYFIQRLTGINDKMVRHAPSFGEIAGQVYDMLQDKVFVAHNVNFDYSFLKHHLKEEGYELNTKKLCTVRLARKIIPGYKSYSLGKLCHSVGIRLDNAHRAGGDAKATAELFALLVREDVMGEIKGMVKGRNREQYLPPNVPVEQVDNLPPVPGVYYFYNAKGKVIYIGKAVNLSKRVKSHFSNNKPNRQKQEFLREIHRISYTECATDLMAQILESTEIRRLWPSHNRSQRGYIPRFGLFVYEDRNGYKRFAIEKNKQHYKPIYTFNTIIEGHGRLRELIQEFGLCARLCNLSRGDDCSESIYADSCEGACTGVETMDDYNIKVEAAITHMEEHLPTFALVDKGINDEEQSCILVKQGNFYGMGYIANEDILEDIKKLENHLEPYQDNDYIRNLVIKHAAEYPDKCITF